MPVCNVCGSSYYDFCHGCDALYRQDIQEGRIPPQFIAAGEEFTYQDWVYIRVAERYQNYQIFDPEEREKSRIHHVQVAIETCLQAHQLRRDADATTAKQQLAAQAKQIRNRYTY